VQLGIANVGTLTLSASLENTALSGEMTLALAQPIEVVSGVSVQSVTLTGRYSPDGFELDGNVTVNVKDWAQASIEGQYKYSANQWSATGTISQITPLTVGPLTVSNGQLQVRVTDNNLEQVTVECDYQVENFSGHVDGRYEVAANEFFLDGNINLDSEYNIGGSGVVLKSATGTAKIEANALTEIRGAASADIPYENQPTFNVTVEDVFVDVPNNQFSGRGTATLINPMTISSGATTVNLNSGSASVGVSQNNLDEVVIEAVEFDANTTFGEHQIAVGGTVNQGRWAEGQVDLNADVTLNSPLTFTRESTTITLSSGSVNVDVQQSALQSLGLKGIQTALRTEVAGAALVVSSNLNSGSITGEGKISFDADMSLDEDYVLSRDPTTMTLKSGATAHLNVQENSLVTAGVQGVNFEFRTTLGGGPLSIDGSINNGTLTPEGVTVSAGASLTDDFNWTVGDTTLTVKSGEGQVDAQITNSNFERVGINNVGFRVATTLGGSALTIGGNVETGELTAETFGVRATAALEEDFVWDRGETGVCVKSEPGQATLVVEGSRFVSAGIDNVGFDAWATLGGSRLELTGTVQTGSVTPDGFTVQAQADLKDDFVWTSGPTTLTVKKPGDGGGGQASLDIQNSSFQRAGIDNVGFEVATTLGGSALTVEGTVQEGSLSSEGFTVQATAGLKEDFVWTVGSTTLTVEHGQEQAQIDVSNSRFNRLGIDNVSFGVDTTLG
ncbi:MAG: hypothetical protein KC561_13270, partial [Myxococcales bacterium]|nr:hypothetical protein [Myxococcales bacterium]